MSFFRLTLTVFTQTIKDSHMCDLIVYLKLNLNDTLAIANHNGCLVSVHLFSFFGEHLLSLKIFN